MVLLHRALDLVSGSFVLGLSFLVFAGVCSLMFPWAPHEAMRDSVPNADWKQAFILCQPRPKRKSDLSVKKHGVFLLTWAEVRFESVGWRVQPDIKGAGIFLEWARGGEDSHTQRNQTFPHLFMGEFELSNNLSQMRNNFTRPENAKLILFCEVTIHCCNARAVPRSAWAQSENSRRKTHGSLGVEVAIGAGSPASSNQKGGRGGLVSLTKGVLSEQTKKQVLRFQAAKLQCISLCTHIYICKILCTYIHNSLYCIYHAWIAYVYTQTRNWDQDWVLKFNDVEFCFMTQMSHCDLRHGRTWYFSLGSQLTSFFSMNSGLVASCQLYLWACSILFHLVVFPITCRWSERPSFGHSGIGPSRMPSASAR